MVNQIKNKFTVVLVGLFVLIKIASAQVILPVCQAAAVCPTYYVGGDVSAANGCITLKDGVVCGPGGGGRGISGSGTTGFVPLFTGSTAIGDSVLQQSGSEIGLGGNPSYTFDVFGDVHVSGSFYGDGTGITGLSCEPGSGSDSVVCVPSFNTATGGSSTTGGGQGNHATAYSATVSGGGGNHADGAYSTVGGGAGNTSGSVSDTVSGGSGNNATGGTSTVSGGSGGNASGPSSTVGGGGGNTASANSATVPGGMNNIAAGQYSFAAGLMSNASTDGSFVWNDSEGFQYTTHGTDDFNIHASEFFGDVSTATLSTTYYFGPPSDNGSAPDEGGGSFNNQTINYSLYNSELINGVTVYSLTGTISVADTSGNNFQVDLNWTNYPGLTATRIFSDQGYFIDTGATSLVDDGSYSGWTPGFPIVTPSVPYFIPYAQMGQNSVQFGLASPQRSLFGDLVNGLFGINTTSPDNALQVNQADGSTLIDFRDSTQSTYIGKSAGGDKTSNNNTAVGYAAMSINSSGTGNTAVGFNSMDNNVSGVDNSAFGRTSLQNNSSGNSNTAVGAEALGGNTSGSNNVAVGEEAIFTVSTSHENTAIGTQAGQLMDAVTPGISNHNSLIGYQAAFFLGLAGTEADNNTIIGDSSGYNLQGGSSNTFIGSNAGSIQTDGNGNILIGYNVGTSLSTTINNAIDIGDLIYGDTSVGWIGIGTNSVGVAGLSVQGDVSVSGNVGGSTLTGDGSNISNLRCGSGTGPGSTLCTGGGSNSASNNNATVSGGSGNTASGINSFVGGGDGDLASERYTVVGGGYHSHATNWFSIVVGGESNVASGKGSFIGGGGYDGLTDAANLASGGGSTITGGLSNTASGRNSSVPGGAYNVASGTFSFAAGQQAQAISSGTFVWADSTNSTYSDNGVNTFNVRSSGGAYFNVNSINVGTSPVTWYYCTGSTAGTFDGNLARGNSNAGACAGGTWVATKIKSE